MSGMIWVRLGAILGALAVSAGAFGAHGLRGRLGARELDLFETAAMYQMYHALALVGVGLLAASGRGGTASTVAGATFVAGILIFSGTIYALSFSGPGWLGAITPIGGVLLIAGWVALAVAATSGPAARPLGGDAP